MLRFAAISCLLLLGGGCSALMDPWPQETAAAIDDQTCKDMGAQPGSDAFVQCRLQQQARRDQADAQRRQNMINAGRELQRAGTPSAPVSCESRRTGKDTWRTDC